MAFYNLQKCLLGVLGYSGHILQCWEIFCWNMAATCSPYRRHWGTRVPDWQNILTWLEIIDIRHKPKLDKTQVLTNSLNRYPTVTLWVLSCFCLYSLLVSVRSEFCHILALAFPSHVFMFMLDFSPKTPRVEFLTVSLGLPSLLVISRCCLICIVIISPLLCKP